MYNIMLCKEIYINILSTHQYVSWDSFFKLVLWLKLIFLTDCLAKPSKESHTHPHENRDWDLSAILSWHTKRLFLNWKNYYL